MELNSIHKFHSRNISKKTFVHKIVFKIFKNVSIFQSLQKIPKSLTKNLPKTRRETSEKQFREKNTKNRRKNSEPLRVEGRGESAQ